MNMYFQNRFCWDEKLAFWMRAPTVIPTYDHLILVVMFCLIWMVIHIQIQVVNLQTANLEYMYVSI